MSAADLRRRSAPRRSDARGGPGEVRCAPVEDWLAGPLGGAPMSSATEAWLTRHVRGCLPCARDLRAVIRANAVLGELVRRVVSGRSTAGDGAPPTASESAVLGTRDLSGRFSSVMGRVGADVERDLAGTARRMLACRALRMVGCPELPASTLHPSTDRGREPSMQELERALADRARERLRDADGLREPIEPGLRRGVETLLQRRRSRERMRRDYQRARRLLAADRRSDSPDVLELSDGAACRAVVAWAAAVITSTWEARLE